MWYKAREPTHHIPRSWPRTGEQSRKVFVRAAGVWVSLEIAHCSCNFICLLRGPGARTGMWLQTDSFQAIVCRWVGRVLLELHTSAPHFFILQQKAHTGTEEWQHASCIIALSVLFFLLYKIQCQKKWLISLSSDFWAFQLKLEKKKKKEFLCSQRCLALVEELKQVESTGREVLLLLVLYRLWWSHKWTWSPRLQV